MRKNFISFWKDYAEVTNASWNWLKKHWFGYIILTIVLVGVQWAWFFRSSIKDRIEDFFSTKLNKCVEEEREELD